MTHVMPSKCMASRRIQRSPSHSPTMAMAKSPNPPNSGGSTVPTSAPMAVHTTTMATAKPLPIVCSPWTAICVVESSGRSVLTSIVKRALTSPTAASLLAARPDVFALS